MFLGQGLLGTATSQLIARLEVPASGTTGAYTLVSESISGTSPVTGAVRVYTFGTDGDQVTTTNASWNGTDWTADTASFGSSKLVLDPAGSTFSTQSAGHSPWTDSAWAAVSTGVLANPIITVSGLNIEVTGTNATALFAFGNGTDDGIHGAGGNTSGDGVVGFGGGS